MPFPKEFVWGAATASYQIEGAAFEDGRGETIWDRFARTPGKVKNGDTGDVACDHYHRYKDDVALMKQVGLQAYRFSVAWSRILPTGTGSVNQKGLDFYSKLVDELLAAGIEPYLTLYHWDLPQVLQDKGGWANPEIIQWFTDYTQVLADHLGDRVKQWMTLNEPWCLSILSHWMGVHAPGLRDAPTAYQTAHNALLAHAQGVRVLRERVPQAQVGIALNMEYAIPASDSEADRQAAWRYDGFYNRWFADPVFKGHYPADMVEVLGNVLDGIDLDAIQGAAVPLDFVGLNYYTCKHVTDGNHNALVKVGFKPNPSAPHTLLDWEICPAGLTSLILRLHHDYAAPRIYITENGSAFADPSAENGIVEDTERVAYLKAHLSAIEDAIAQGAPVGGYFAWSLMDNFEWAEGYSPRFGLIHVDYQTQARTLKRSALTYQAMASAAAS